MIRISSLMMQADGFLLPMLSTWCLMYVKTYLIIHTSESKKAANTMLPKLYRKPHLIAVVTGFG